MDLTQYNGSHLVIHTQIQSYFIISELQMEKQMSDINKGRYIIAPICKTIKLNINKKDAMRYEIIECPLGSASK